MQKIDFELLLHIARSAGLGNELRTSTAKIASQLEISQQSVSRKLRALKTQNLIFLQAAPSGCSIRVTQHGAKMLEQRMLELKQVFAPKKAHGKTLCGRVVPGLNEGRYYVSFPQYLQQFKNLLGFKPFFGTLNLIVDEQELRNFIAGLAPIEIKGFETPQRSFGKITAYKISAKGIDAALLFPERSHHAGNEIEIIAPVNLRRKFKLREGSRFCIESQHQG